MIRNNPLRERTARMIESISAGAAWPLRAKLAIEMGNCWLPTPVISTRSCADEVSGNSARSMSAHTARRIEAGQ
jgi:hypothetical protein